MRVAGYLRCSTKKQELEGQRRAVTDWAAREEHELTVFTDDHVSGRRSKRHGIEQLLAAVERGEFDAVAVTELSRLGRSLGFVHQVVDAVAKRHMRIVLVATGSVIDPNTLEGKALLGALALAAEIEWHLIAERNARGRATIKARGVKVGRKPKEISATVLRALRDRGLSVRQIARELGHVSPATVGRRLQDLAHEAEPSVA